MANSEAISGLNPQEHQDWQHGDDGMERHSLVGGKVIRPQAEAWAALRLPRSGWKHGVVAWLIAVITTGIAYVVDRGWEDLEDDLWVGPYDALDMFDLASAGLLGGFVAIGWFLGRRGLTITPLVLLIVAISFGREGEPAATAVWWVGTALAGLWAFSYAAGALRSLAQVRSLARASLTERETLIGPNAKNAVTRFFRRRAFLLLSLAALTATAWTITILLFSSERGRQFEGPDGDIVSDLIATVAVAATLLAIAEAVLFFWRLVAVRAAGHDLVWEVPQIEGAAAPYTPIGLRAVIEAEDLRADSCICRTEWSRADPEGEYELSSDDDIPVSDYCPDHGIDRINASTQSEFLAMTHEPWIWDESSVLPQSSNPDAQRTLLYGFAGPSFAGIVLREKSGVVDASSPYADPITMEQPAIRSYDGYHGDYNQAQRPGAGMVDEIDLRPVGYDGSAFRYRHGRAWYESAQSHPEDERER
ncbi:hypothetical protein GCM10027404_32920 [Arthrobacter tumbae]